jgi:hypothetical protein
MWTGTNESGMPTENLFDPQPGLRARFIPNGVNTVQFIVDLGAVRTLGAMALVNSTLTGAETLRFRTSEVDPTVASFDYSIDATATTPDATRGQITILRSADLSARYVWFRFTNCAAVLDIGNIAVFETFRFAIRPGLGMVEGRLPSGILDRNPFTRTEHRLAGLVNARYARVTVPSILASEYDGTLRAVLDAVHPSDDVLWIPDTDLSAAELNRRSIYGALTRPGEDVGFSYNRPQRAQFSFQIAERA